MKRRKRSTPDPEDLQNDHHQQEVMDLTAEKEKPMKRRKRGSPDPEEDLQNDHQQFYLMDEANNTTQVQEEPGK